jgi:hypothetical protein
LESQIQFFEHCCIGGKNFLFVIAREWFPQDGKPLPFSMQKVYSQKIAGVKEEKNQPRRRNWKKYISQIFLFCRYSKNSYHGIWRTLLMDCYFWLDG